MAFAPAPLITLTTDFGTRDWFVGAMKGVIALVAPEAVVIDLTHGISRGDIHAGAFVLAVNYDTFPKGTIHVAVVDPGVGTPRKALVIQTQNYFFVGPDNGVLSWALRPEKIEAIHAIENGNYFLQPPSQTFHGRDIFAPVAAHLSRGVALDVLGRRLKRFVHLAWPEARTKAGAVCGEIVYIDQFGNAITNIAAGVLGAKGGLGLLVFLGGKPVCAVRPSYGSVSPNQPLAVLGSSDLIEIAVNGGSAAEVFGLKVGDAVDLRPQ